MAENAVPRLPDKLYRVYTTKRRTNVPYGSLAGGTFTRLDEAKKRIARIRRQGGDAVVMVTDTNWRPLEDLT